MTGFVFAYPWLLVGLLTIPALMLWRLVRGRAPALVVPYASEWVSRARPFKWDWRIALLYAAVALLIVAAARPQRISSTSEQVSHGYALMLAIDLSSSMLAEDYRDDSGPINRLEAVRPILESFISKRPRDRIGVVAFAGRAVTLSPLTSDHDWLVEQVRRLEIGMIEDGTAIGDGLGLSLANLEKAGIQDAGAFVILLTDGANTSGRLTPPEATAIARHRGVPLYTIAAGRNGMVPFPIFDDAGRRIGTRLFPSALDEAALETMAKETGGRAFAAGDADAVAEAFAAIDAARKARFSTRKRLSVEELFLWPAVPGLALLLLSLLLLRKRRKGATRPHILRGWIVAGKMRLAREQPLPWRLTLAILLAAAAVARPQAGEERAAPTAATGNVLLALDLSRSMLARDVQPSRLEQARALAQELAEALPDQRLGLLGFAGSAHLLAPVSDDRALFDAFLSTVQPSHIRAQGSDFAALVDAAAAAKPDVLIVMSDGEASPGRWQASALNGIPTFAVGFGTREGALLSDAGQPIVSDGRQVRSRLEPATLARLGRSMTGTDPAALAAAVRKALAARQPDAANDAPRPVELFPWIFGTALLLLAWSAATEWPARPRLAGWATSLAALLLVHVPLFAAKPPPIALELHGQEEDPLEAIKAIVAKLVMKPERKAADYRALAEAAVRYGEIHRGHAHPLEEGVLRDGLAAVAVGRRLAPDHASWIALDARLKRLLEPPPPVPPEGDSPHDPANEPVDARQEVPVPDDQDQGQGEDAPPEERQVGLPTDDMQRVGGGERDLYDPNEWRNPSLIHPLQELERLRRADTPAKMFRLMQAAEQRRPGARQTW